MTKFLLPLLLLALLPALEASGKCRYSWYEVSGKVSDSTNRPILGALVSASWSDGAGERSAQVRTLKNGTYQLKFAFSTFSGPGNIPGHDACGAVLAEIPVVVTADGFERTRSTVVLKVGKGNSNMVLRHKLVPNNSFKPKPLRGSA